MSGRRRIIAALRRASRNALILGAIETLVLAGGIEIEIMLGDDSRMRGVIAGQDRRMTGAGFGGAVRLITRRQDDYRRQPRTAAAEMAAQFAEQLGGNMIDSATADEHGRRGRVRPRWP